MSNIPDDKARFAVLELIASELLSNENEPVVKEIARFDTLADVVAWLSAYESQLPYIVVEWLENGQWRIVNNKDIMATGKAYFGVLSEDTLHVISAYRIDAYRRKGAGFDGGVIDKSADEETFIVFEQNEQGGVTFLAQFETLADADKNLASKADEADYLIVRYNMNAGKWKIIRPDENLPTGKARGGAITIETAQKIHEYVVMNFVLPNEDDDTKDFDPSKTIW